MVSPGSNTPLIAPDGVHLDLLGSSVSISRDDAIVGTGARGFGPPIGYAYVFSGFSTMVPQIASISESKRLHRSSAENSGFRSESALAELALFQNHPNPFNPSTTIRYALSADDRVSVRVYDMLGQEVATLFDGFQNAGEQSAIWNGTNKAGATVASGLYICRVQTGHIVLTEKMLFAK